jgi:histidine triad (HIT) family protein
MNDCIFCKVVRGDIPIHHKIYEDEYTLAFLDITPNSLGHTLVVTKEHFENIYSTPDEDWCRLMLAAKKIAIAVKNGLDAEGINVTMNNERAAGQIIHHDHIHIIPRYIDDGVRYSQHITYKPGEAEEAAKKIKAAL